MGTRVLAATEEKKWTIKWRNVKLNLPNRPRPPLPRSHFEAAAEIIPQEFTSIGARMYARSVYESKYEGREYIQKFVKRKKEGRVATPPSSSRARIKEIES